MIDDQFLASKRLTAELTVACEIFSFCPNSQLAVVTVYKIDELVKSLLLNLRFRKPPCDPTRSNFPNVFLQEALRIAGFE